MGKIEKYKKKIMETIEGKNYIKCARIQRETDLDVGQARRGLIALRDEGKIKKWGCHTWKVLNQPCSS
jgi:hypothetical protein